MKQPPHDPRYVTDVPYARRFVRELSPAWLDFSATICGAAPPERGDGFTWCELGCGHGVTPALLAATLPRGHFVGIDLMPEHITFAEKLCREAGIDNAIFHACDFAAAAQRDLPAFDYIVAHGVYTWIDAGAQADLLAFVARHLKPGGILYLSYNTLPGWAADMPLQHLLQQLAARAPGDGIARLDAADQAVTALARAGSDVLQTGAMGREWRELRAKLPPAYFVHELLPPAWRPLYVTEVRRATAALGLVPIGSATIRENVDAFTLDRAAQILVAQQTDPDLRELMRDYLLMKRFRRDLFGRAAPDLPSNLVRARVLATRFMLAETGDAPGSAPLGFKDPVALRILDLLQAGPNAPAALESEGIARADLVGQILALAAAGRIWPVEAADAEGEAWHHMNAALLRRRGSADAIDFTLRACGIAVEGA
jgi:SAM-dependent methyltransferase